MNHDDGEPNDPTTTLRGKTTRRRNQNGLLFLPNGRKKEVFTKRSLIAVFNRLADSDEPPQKN